MIKVTRTVPTVHTSAALLCVTPVIVASRCFTCSISLYESSGWSKSCYALCHTLVCWNLPPSLIDGFQVFSLKVHMLQQLQMMLVASAKLSSLVCNGCHAGGRLVESQGPSGTTLGSWLGSATPRGDFCLDLLPLAPVILVLLVHGFGLSCSTH